MTILVTKGWMFSFTLPARGDLGQNLGGTALQGTDELTDRSRDREDQELLPFQKSVELFVGTVKEEDDSCDQGL